MDDEILGTNRRRTFSYPTLTARCPKRTMKARQLLRFIDGTPSSLALAGQQDS